MIDGQYIWQMFEFRVSLRIPIPLSAKCPPDFADTHFLRLSHRQVVQAGIAIAEDQSDSQLESRGVDQIGIGGREIKWNFCTE